MCDSVLRTIQDIDDGSGLTIPRPPPSLNGGANADEIASHKSGYTVRTMRILIITLDDVEALQNSMFMMSEVQEEWKRDEPKMRHNGDTLDNQRRLLDIMRPVLRFFDVHGPHLPSGGCDGLHSSMAEVGKEDVRLCFNDRSDATSSLSFGVCVRLKRDARNGGAPVAAFKWFGLGYASCTCRSYSVRFGDIENGEDTLRMEPDDSDDEEDEAAMATFELSSLSVDSKEKKKERGTETLPSSPSQPLPKVVDKEKKKREAAAAAEAAWRKKFGSEEARKAEMTKLGQRARALTDSIRFKTAMAKHPHSSARFIDTPFPPRSTSLRIYRK